MRFVELPILVDRPDGGDGRRALQCVPAYFNVDVIALVGRAEGIEELEVVFGGTCYLRVTVDDNLRIVALPYDAVKFILATDKGNANLVEFVKRAQTIDGADLHGTDGQLYRFALDKSLTKYQS